MKKAKEKEQKAAEKKIKAELYQQRNTGRSTRSHNKENLPSTCEGVKVMLNQPYPPAKATDQQNECSVCLGRYEDDFVEGVLQKEWIRGQPQPDHYTRYNTDEFLILVSVRFILVGAGGWKLVTIYGDRVMA